MTKVNRYNGQQRRTQNLAQRRKQYKPLEVGQTLTQPTADPKLKETTGTIDFSQPKPVVTNPQNVSTAEAIEQLNKQQEAQNLEKQQKNIERQLKKAQDKVEKNKKRVTKLEKEVANILDKFDYEFAIQSFNILSLRWFKKNNPQYIRGYLVNGIYSQNKLFNIFILSKLFKYNIIYVGKDNIFMRVDYYISKLIMEVMDLKVSIGCVDKDLKNSL